MNFKFFVLFILQFIFMSTLHAQGQQIVKIEFASATRGFHKNINMTKDSVLVVQQKLTDEKEVKSSRKIKAKEWESLMRSLNAVSLQDVPGLKSPTHGRNADAARHSTITITTSGGQSFAHSFDNENPNEKLQLLMSAIRKISNVK